MKETDSKTSYGWNFDNSYARLPELFFTRLDPKPVSSPSLIVLNERLAAAMGLDPEALRGGRGAEFLAGNAVPEGAEPLAQAYAGHQFGHFNRLGDGRAILLGEQITPEGHRIDIQLKGSGPTPYSRRGDGRAALGPMLREHIISEAMHGLGIPTTRSLAVTATGDDVYRESVLPGAVLTRTAASHLRVGTFQYAAQWGTMDELERLSDYALQRHYAGLCRSDDAGRHLVLLRGVVDRQAALIAKWMLAGFIHGVMNTDNMAISGETIDYGPCAFMDAFDPATVFSSIDSQGRYAYGSQPHIGAWNLARLAESLLPLLHDDEEEAVRLAEHELRRFSDSYGSHWLNGMRAKLGLCNEEPEDQELVDELLRLMKEEKADYTNTFRFLTTGKRLQGDTLFDSQAFSAWMAKRQARLDRQPQSSEQSAALMRASNPAVIPRNHRVEEALAAAEQGDLSVMEKLLSALESPYAHRPGQDEFAVPSGQTAASYRTFCGT
ncbi:protein adenylyltransferase SelO [Paenibacillus humicus]|uniref:protein adenylyltransferase SelO n=1 Tax=Paenibacillus humicus TaxID=412861 RepID=UPI000FD6D618|nr:YdiU family protein [Paenibacillus humicus]